MIGMILSIVGGVLGSLGAFTMFLGGIGTADMGMVLLFGICLACMLTITILAPFRKENQKAIAITTLILSIVTLFLSLFLLFLPCLLILIGSIIQLVEGK